MAKLLMIVPDRFEDVEAIATLDVLKRGGHSISLVSVMKRKEVVTKCGYHLLTDACIEDIDINEYDGLIIPGGPGSFTILNTLDIVDTLIHSFMKSNKLVAAICAAPDLITRLGYLDNKEYTCHPGFENYSNLAIYRRDLGVCRSNSIITAKSMFYSVEFGLKIHEYFTSKESSIELLKSLQGEGE